MVQTVIDEPNKYKEEGNDAFKSEKWDLAVNLYTKAIKLGEKSKDLPVYYKNRAAAYLKLNEHEKALSDCTEVLKISPKDPKALFRRSQALESLERYEEAYRDAREVWNCDPTNKSVKPILERLHKIVQERSQFNSQTINKVTQMCEIAFDIASPEEKRKTAISNLLVLAREPVGAEMMAKEGVPGKIARLLKIEKNNEIIVNAIRTIDEMCTKSVSRTKQIIDELGIPWFLQVLDSSFEDRVSSAQHCMQTVLNVFSGMENKTESKPDQKLIDEHTKEIDTLLTCLVYSITNPVITGEARDAIMELIIRNVHYNTLNWANRLVEIRGLIRLMTVCSELEEYKYESAMNITPSSRTIAAVCLARVYENMYYDAAREQFLSQIDEYIKDKLLAPDIESKVRVTVAITSLLLGPLDVGNTIVSREGILQMILVMATTDDVLQQKVACECIIAAASKKDKAKSIINNGINILKKLYTSKDDGIRVRALVGLCKLGSSGGTDASIRPFADGSTRKLAEACRRFLIKPGKDRDIRKWAAEGLSYLTLDADVKEKLVEDRPAIQALIELAKTGDQSVIYGVITTFVNLCNAYEGQELLPEMVELAKFAKHHIPEEHELDDPDFVSGRITILGNEGITTALVALSKTESHNSRELISRVFNALCSEQELRGIVVQQGGSKALLPLSLEGTAKGKRQAAQALSRIGITINPEVAFPGQRNLEVIRPLVAQLHPDCTALENFESLMALCNLASMNETVRQRILREEGLVRIEIYLMQEHEMLRRAATQVICNLVLSPDCIKLHEKDNDRVKFLALLCEEEDEDTAKAASGALAVLTSQSEICCRKMLSPQSWLNILHTLIANPSPEVQHRGIVIIYNMISSCKDVAAKVFETDVMELLMGLSQLPDETRAKARTVAQECLKYAEKYKLIQKKEEDELDAQHQEPDVFKEAEIHEIED